MSDHSSSRIVKAFTLVELLVVIAVIAILIALLLPAVQSAREAARRAQCLNNLKQLAIAQNTYHAAYNVFSPGYTTLLPKSSPTTEMGPGWGWGCAILPFLEQGPLYASLNQNAQILDPASLTVRTTSINTFLCPDNSASPAFSLNHQYDTSLSQLDLAVGHYVGCAGQSAVIYRTNDDNGVLYRNSRVGFSDVIDGSSSTLMFGERSRNVANATWVGVLPEGVDDYARMCTNPSWPQASCGHASSMVLGCTGPDQIGLNYVITPNSKLAAFDAFWSLHPGGANFAFCDGSVRFLKETIDPGVFAAMATRASGEIVTDQ